MSNSPKPHHIIEQVIPPSIQEPARKRLKMLRESRGLMKIQVKSLSRQSLKLYEDKELSSMKLSSLYALAEEYEIPFEKLVSLLFGEQDSAKELQFRSPYEEVILNYLKLLPEETLRRLADHVSLLVRHEQNG